MARHTPKAVEEAKATQPRANTSRLSTFRKTSALIKQPTLIPRRMVRIFIKALAAVSANRSVTPLSFSRLPNMNMPMRGADLGTSRIMITAAIIGKMSFSRLDTALNWGFMYIARSALVVSSFITGG